MEDDAVEAFREVNLSDGKCNVSLYVCAEEEKKIDEDPEYASELFKAALEGRLPAACDDSETGGGWSDNAAEDTNGRGRKKKTVDIEWDSEATWVFLKVIKKNTNLLPLNTGNRKQLFRKVKEDLLAIGCDIPFESIRQKFNSLITTYKRIQFKAKRVGKVETRWEFYEVFDEIMKEAEAESIKLKNKNGTVDMVKDPEFVDIKLEPDFLGVDDDDDDDDDDPDEFCPSPPLTHLENSNNILREASPERCQVQEIDGKPESPEKCVKAVPGPASKKRKMAETNNVTPTKDPLEKSLPDSPIKTITSSVKKVGDASSFTPGDVAASSVIDGGMKGAEHVILSGEGFNHAATLLFIDCIKKHKNMLKMKKSAEMFTQIRKQMSSEGFSFTEAKLRKKWYNLLISYRRILERANETGDLVSSWPYYEAVDSIIVDTKVLAQNRENNINGYTSSHEASTSKTSKGHRLSDSTRVGGFRDDDDTNCATPKERGNKASSVIDLLKRSDDWSNNSNNEEDGEFQRNFLEEWEQRELRREERDIVKLEVLKKIARSMVSMNRKQDLLIDLLKNLK